ncbi:hypothetical protein Lokhon_00970 [Limimaricola hongkongensis DSM 17492]|uniref:Uncharacterized protein n=1 Tax=Limimaricola hongkongensis DSM 17492 TaxID=1122180 RepID=A0A017HEG8_9RHOB|nr:hypothetical protein Lokhon_00970 [Limimaricola hongkongensis DSM 17492]
MARSEARKEKEGPKRERGRRGRKGNVPAHERDYIARFRDENP